MQLSSNINNFGHIRRYVNKFHFVCPSISFSQVFPQKIYGKFLSFNYFSKHNLLICEVLSIIKLMVGYPILPLLIFP